VHGADQGLIGSAVTLTGGGASSGMMTWIALLRGVNVGGSHKLPTKRLRDILDELGFVDAVTYIQSGNCVFRSDLADGRTIGARIAERIAAEFGFRPSVFALTRKELDAAIDDNPFAGRSDDPKFVHLFFLAEKVCALDEPAMRALAAPSDDFVLAGKVFYLLTPGGIGRSKLVDKLEKFLPVDMTARNLRSAIKIAELARSVGT
jgi:uncharacterized protein (DUF1697 family)